MVNTLIIAAAINPTLGYPSIRAWLIKTKLRILGIVPIAIPKIYNFAGFSVSPFAPNIPAIFPQANENTMVNIVAIIMLLLM